jgi:hypothetical protein
VGLEDASRRWVKSAALALAPPLEDWPEFDYSSLPTEDKEFVEKREAAVRMVVGGKTYKQVREATGLHQNQIRKLTMTCLSQASGGRILGFRGLLPYTRFRANTRRSPVLPKRADQHGGMSCSLQDTLSRYPDLERKLVAQIRKETKTDAIPEFRIKGTHLHRIFTTELKKLGVTENQWSFTAKYKGMRSVVTFMREVLAGDFPRAVAARGGKDAKAHLATGSRQPRYTIPFARQQGSL